MDRPILSGGTGRSDHRGAPSRSGGARQESHVLHAAQGRAKESRRGEKGRRREKDRRKKGRQESGPEGGEEGRQENRQEGREEGRQEESGQEGGRQKGREKRRQEGRPIGTDDGSVRRRRPDAARGTLGAPPSSARCRARVAT